MAMQFPQTGSPIGDFGSNPLARLVTKERRLSAPPCRSCTNQRRTAVRTEAVICRYLQHPVRRRSLPLYHQPG